MSAIVPYRTLRPYLSTFDILNCRHKDLFWRLIGHTATIYADKNTNTVFVYESTQMKHAADSGVQLRPMSSWLRAYPGEVFVRKVYISDSDMAREALAKAQQHIKQYRGTPYPALNTRQGRLFLLRSAWDSRIFRTASTNEDTDRWFFCTMLVVHLLRFCGLVKPEVNPAELEPDDMRPGGKFERDCLFDGIWVGDEVRLK